MTTRTFSAAALLVSLGLSACAEGASGGVADDEGLGGAEDEAVGVADDASSLAGRFTYFAVRPDTRRCAFPSCGGYFVARVNQAATRCADGSDQPECYVVELDLSRGGVSVADAAAVREDASRVLLRGSVKGRIYGADRLGLFDATEVWRSARAPEPSPGGEPAPARFFRLGYAGSCGEGCPSLAAAPLNASFAAEPVAWIALDRALAPAERGAAVNAAFGSRLLAEGVLAPPTGERRGSTFVAARTFARVASGGRLAEACLDASTCAEGFVCCAGQCAAACR